MSTEAALLKLQSWFSPSFPVGGYTYSHGLEYGVECGLIHHRESLQTWLEGLLQWGAGHGEGVLFHGAYGAAVRQDWAALHEVTVWAQALRPTAELALESRGQGRAFLVAVQQGWPHPWVQRWGDGLAEHAPYGVVTGLACAAHGVPEAMGLSALLHGMVAGWISAAVRLIPLGQQAGVLVQSALEGEIQTLVRALLSQPASAFQAELGGCAWMAEWCSLKHETQYTRLFRS
ncbi:Urease accessory protein UreF [Magnetococcus marinus MC-1]|uniref:Urease accessory protein UreF n=1 Tax=Magnetococcus marinus (strain ATCC BAA-1437 / JCM 17883 / MC-1) TaxID=156889 RepID=UREF_MAGMM|nr:urease accessory UreF family protein [Magnetococcus marinus]A0L6F4.1 RecName: Full=Urease accessory protein UreF [Magnetococcus marinus MC-1]ABK43547.1 Urease accessory protein UreF [Magnetococcus marinus MC-1]